MSYLENDAVISDCEKYRYLLRRVWDHAKPRALFIMLNPSTADAKVDDPTIRSCVRLARGLGYGSIEVVNIFGWRATDPAELPKQPDPIGPMNERIVVAAIGRCDVVICAWGANAMAARKSNFICGLIRPYRPVPYCLGTTKSGSPRHPLYVKSGTALEMYRPQ
jgi:hypothetical protein